MNNDAIILDLCAGFWVNQFAANSHNGELYTNLVFTSKSPINHAINVKKSNAKT